MSFWEAVWLILVPFAFIAYLMAMFAMERIAEAEKLVDSGAIGTQEFGALKAEALA